MVRGMVKTANRVRRGRKVAVGSILVGQVLNMGTEEKAVAPSALEALDDDQRGSLVMVRQPKSGRTVAQKPPGRKVSTTILHSRAIKPPGDMQGTAVSRVRMDLAPG